MLLLDTTGSMQGEASQHSFVSRLDVVKRSIGFIVKELADADTEFEQGNGQGGLRTVTFSGGYANDIGDLNPGNLDQKFNNIVWEGSTLIVAGFSKILDIYNGQFGDLPLYNQPKMVTLVITDGEALDINDLAVMILTMDFTNIYLVFALIGFGTDYENARVRLAELSKLNNHIRVIEMKNETQAHEIANVCLSLVR
ncbi:UNVERIFIED_CONTAM: hypothetical protein HDU68_007286 [Siphonaria sp. JEL0065]|nr:hypothetical protein HDU68_007286 [Siphonaria sp. JEL0065]